MKPMTKVAIGIVLAGAYSTAAEAGSSDFKCFEMYGSLVPAAGHPTFRISPKTASGLVALQEVFRHGKEIDPLPANVMRLFPSDRRAVETIITGDFIICPLEQPHPAKLRLAKMTLAKHLTVRTDNWLEQSR